MAKLFIACDHAAYLEKVELIKFLTKLGHEVQDLGPHSADRVDYPDFAREVCKEVQHEKGLGILLCGSGIGMSIAANRYKNIRAALCRTEKEAELSKQHNNANILCLGARINTQAELESITKAWLLSEFEKGRHSDRVAKFNDLGEVL
ncbi:MAG: ribose 5-phosphate isomerase B [Bdellovibrio sp. CG12_big_fil_rev_8_21_14_0_65_39_13]|nr:MAG: ribose 5-phosphate isomerase B [Bdellovibrio sp. CG22_combo_CG10-13_8_21_14_all_39_27]PIQ58693.1 MAG: ribose 5-phosphate isomerase B [Bdellovibrio sp. CG12_big_fil_rev_8_21_14_0_65_39_13]PIR33068.1 MAG: ribose 5-phosphate isomerase B [Bdellovibrio sp. CG11_big_fil_rev_8_21_14_0_20_39_38]